MELTLFALPDETTTRGIVQGRQHDGRTVNLVHGDRRSVEAVISEAVRPHWRISLNSLGWNYDKANVEGKGK